MIKHTAIVLTVLVATGCSSAMLPKKYTVTHNHWTEYKQVHSIGTNIRAGQSLDDLKNRTSVGKNIIVTKFYKKIYK